MYLSLTNELLLRNQLAPVQPQRVVHKLMLNMCLCDKSMRAFLLNALIGLLRNERQSVLKLLAGLNPSETSSPDMPTFPPSSLIGKSSWSIRIPLLLRLTDFLLLWYIHIRFGDRIRRTKLTSQHRIIQEEADRQLCNGCGS